MPPADSRHGLPFPEPTTPPLERTLDGGGPTVRLWWPQPWGADWVCRYRIDGAGLDVAGIDPLQALTLALQGIRADLAAHHPGATFLGQPHGLFPQVVHEPDAVPPPAPA